MDVYLTGDSSVRVWSVDVYLTGDSSVRVWSVDVYGCQQREGLVSGRVPYG